MSDFLLSENLLTFRSLSIRLRGMGIGASPATLHRWRLRYQLKAVRVGGIWYSSLQEFHRFVAKRNDKSLVSDLQDASATNAKNSDW